MDSVCRWKSLQQVVKKATKNERDYRFTVPENFDLLAKASRLESFKRLRLADGATGQQHPTTAMHRSPAEKTQNPLGTVPNRHHNAGQVPSIPLENGNSRSLLGKVDSSTQNGQSKAADASSEESLKRKLDAMAVDQAAPRNPNSSSAWNPNTNATQASQDKSSSNDDAPAVQVQFDGDRPSGRQVSDKHNEDSNRGPGRPCGFQTAKSRLINELKKSGNHQAAANLQRTTHAGPTTGPGHPIRSNTSGLRRVGNTSGGPGGKFVPPFVKKALQAQNGGHVQGNQQEDGSQGPLSQRTLELLRLGMLFDTGGKEIHTGFLCSLSLSLSSFPWAKV